MTTLIFILSLVATFGVGLLISWLFAKNKYVKSRRSFISNIASLSNEKEKLEMMVGQANRELKEERDKVIELNQNVASLETSKDHLIVQLQTQKSDIEKLENKLAKEFENLANRILDEKSEKMSRVHGETLKSILTPLKERIHAFEEKVERSHKDNLERHAGMKQMVYDLRELGIKMSEDAQNLTNALKGSSKTQGAWGEMILERILERSGLVKGREYSVQESISIDGKRLRPDVIINLPDEKKIVVDSKVTLKAFERFASEEDPLAKQQHLKNHVQSFKNHLKNLAGKEYDKLYGINSPDFVLMFVALEPAFNTAIRNFPDIYDYAFERNIIIVGPSTLLATLMTISSIWKQEYQNENVLEIARESGLLYDKFVGFIQDLSEVGKKLDGSRRSFERAMNKLSLGTGNLVRRAEKIRELGAKAKKEIPTNLVKKSKEGEQLEIN
ncbi:MAG: DNA recombination protein RmuC [Chitinophagales bacterium]|nr:DNA recombination protein RmuC [Chitinophagales bacterium]